jgi:hypothetical protein
MASENPSDTNIYHNSEKEVIPCDPNPDLVDYIRCRISDLNVEYLLRFRNLRQLDITTSVGSDLILNLERLSSLSSLTCLKIFGMRIRNLSALHRLPNLEKLVFYGIHSVPIVQITEGDQGLEGDSMESGLEDLSLLSSPDSKLGTLILRLCPDVGALSAISKMKILHTLKLELVDQWEDSTSVPIWLGDLNYVTTLQLKWDGNNMKDIGLNRLVNLISLNLGTSRSIDIAALPSLTNLRSLRLNGLSSEEPLDIAVLSQIANLRELTLMGHILNIDSVNELVNLRELTLICRLPDMSPLTLINLKKLVIEFIGCDLSIVGQLTELEHLYYCTDRSINTAHISKLTKLRHLELIIADYGGEIPTCDISGLIDLTKLEYLNLNIDLNDITPIRNLTNLRELLLCPMYTRTDTYPIDLSNLSNMVELRVLDLSYNVLTNLNHLVNLVKLKELLLIETKISDIGALGELRYLVKLTLPKSVNSGLLDTAHINKIIFTDNDLLIPVIDEEGNEKMIEIRVPSSCSGKEFIELLRKVKGFADGGSGRLTKGATMK